MRREWQSTADNQALCCLLSVACEQEAQPSAQTPGFGVLPRRLHGQLLCAIGHARWTAMLQVQGEPADTQGFRQMWCVHTVVAADSVTKGVEPPSPWQAPCLG